MVRKLRKNLFMKHIKVGLIIRTVARSNKHIVKHIVFLKYKKKKKKTKTKKNKNFRTLSNNADSNISCFRYLL